MGSDRIYKLLSPVWDIPSGTHVTKKTGEKEYVVRREITVYDSTGEKATKIVAKDDTAFFATIGRQWNGQRSWV